MKIRAGKIVFFFSKLLEAYAFLNPIVDFIPVIPLLFFLLAFIKIILNFECCATLQIKIDHNKKNPPVTDTFKYSLIEHFIF